MKRRHFIEKLLMSPQIILVVCLIWITLHLLADGTAFKIWRLSEKEAKLIHSIAVLKQKTQDISLEIQKNYMPDHLEKLARERFDMVRDQDMIFVFSQMPFDDQKIKEKP